MTDQYSQKFNLQPNGQVEEDHPDHDSLVAFLKQNKPIAPPCHSNFEQQLFAEISKYPQRSPAKISRYWAWVAPVLVVAGLGLTWNFSRSQYQTATTLSESEQAAIEQSLINSWSMNDDTTLTASNTSTDSQLLHELAPLEYE